MKTLYAVVAVIALTILGSGVYAQHESYNLGSCSDFNNKLSKQYQARKNGASTYISLQIGDKADFSAKVNHEESIKGGHYLVGSVENGGSFFIKSTPTSLEGNIVFKESENAYKYYSTDDGEAHIEKTDIHEVLCVEYDEVDVDQEESLEEGIVGAQPDLQSLPGATAVAYLDFDGEYVSGTPWNSGNPIDAAPRNYSNSQIAEIWERVAQDFYAFNINVTTNRAVFDAAPRSRRMMAIFTTTTTAAPGSGGVAYLGSFRWNDNTPCWVFNGGIQTAATTASHELGHTFDLRHDGRTSPSEGYYGGHGSWGPIMGAAFGKSFDQWSKGEYANANNQEDDIAIIGSSRNGFGLKSDDHGNTTGSATPLQVSGTGSILSSNWGVIERETDVDLFSFSTSGGSASILVSPRSTWTNLDVQVQILNSSGGLVSTSSSPGLSAQVNLNLTAGTYYIRVDGIGTGNATTGYTDYSSTGDYRISGNIVVGDDPDVVTVYQHCSFGGWSANLAIGSYTTAQLSSLGVSNNNVSSLRVPAELQAVLYDGDNFTGNWLLVTGDDDCIVTEGFNDITSSIIISPAGTPVDCNGEVNGSAFLDDCDICVGGSTGNTPCSNVPPPWVNGDIGAVGAPGYANYDNGTFTIHGSGADVWGTSDEFHFVHQPISGDVEITARVTGIENTDDWAKAGLMIRASTSANSIHGLVAVTPQSGVAFQRRTASGGSSSHTGVSGSAPEWLRLTRIGNTLTAYRSENGSSWTQIGSATISFSATVQVGMFVTSHSDGILNTSTFTNVSVNALTSNDPPAVSITSPANGSTFTEGDNVSITATASDPDGSVASVAFRVNGTLVSTDNSAPYSYTLTNVSTGNYDLTAVATDNEGAQTTSSVVTITVVGEPNDPPVVSITSPSNGATFTEGDNISITASASDPDGSVSSVQFYSGGSSLGTDNSSPYTASINNAAPGTYNLTAVATDNDGGQTTSSTVTITVEEDNTGGCTGVPQYVQNGGYSGGDQVQNAGGVYECKPWPYEGWCNGASWAYGPGTGMYWQDAWVFVSACSPQGISAFGTDATAAEVVVVPNPAEDHIQLLGLEDGASVSICNANGSEVLSLDNPGSSAIDISSLPHGLYVLKIARASGLITLKLAK